MRRVCIHHISRVNSHNGLAAMTAIDSNDDDDYYNHPV